MAEHPVLKEMVKQADGWVKKYVLTYEMPDGSLHEYHCATRREAEEYKAGLERNGRQSRAAMAALEDGAGQLSDGIGRLSSGAGELSDRADRLSNGIDESFDNAADSPTDDSGMDQKPELTPDADAKHGEKPGFISDVDTKSGGEPGFMPDAVCIVARTPRDTLVMEREFRYPLNSWCVALPAGLVDPGEDIFTCAARELSEETGYEVIPDAPMRALPQAGYSSTGLTDETVQVVFVEAEKGGAAHTEGAELIEVFELPIADIDHFLETNRLPIGTRAQLILELMKALAN